MAQKLRLIRTPFNFQMKKYHLIALMTLISFTPTYGQEKEIADENVTFEASTMKSNADRSKMTFFDNVRIKIDNKLEIEADSAVYDRNDKQLITYGTRRFEFRGTVIAHDGYNRVCKYSLGEDMLRIE